MPSHQLEKGGKGYPSKMKHLSNSQHSASPFTYEKEIKTSGTLLFIHSMYSLRLHLLMTDSQSLPPTPSPVAATGSLSLSGSLAVAGQVYLNADASPTAPHATQWEWTSPSIEKNLDSISSSEFSAHKMHSSHL